MGLLGQLTTKVIWTVQSQRGHGLPFAAVGLGLGIGIYFALPAEPTLSALLASGCVALGLLYLGYRFRFGLGGVAVIAAIVLLGVLLAAWRTTQVTAPVLSFRYYGPIEGRILKIDRSASDKVRLLLDKVVLSRMAPNETPAYVRVSLHGAQGYITPAPGQRVILTGHLSPPQGPTEPGGFDFQRHAYFQSLGAVGYTRTPVLLLEPSTRALIVQRFRDRVSKGLAERIGGQAGGVAGAIVVGDRAGLDQDTLRDLRISNLAHLLAISGLHMGLLAGFVFMAVRGGLALIPSVALRYPIKKWAALIALPAAAAYLIVSGSSVATQRAFIQVTVMLLAVLADRRALTLRSVAIAAIIVLCWRPEALLGPGFQMSFAATTALVVVFGALRGRMPRLPAYIAPVVAVFLSSLIAGAATAPISAVHFNQVGQYGVLANMLSVPVMGIWVMPMVVIAAVLAPLGLEALPLWAMGLGLDWILAVAHWVAGLQGALRLIPAPTEFVLPMLALGALWCIVWHSRIRWAGVLPVGIACLLWIGSNRPDVLISASGNLVGVQAPEGRALSKERGDGFVAKNWLAHDGLPRDQAAFAALWSAALQDRTRISHVYGRGWEGRLRSACRSGYVVVTPKDADAPEGCLVLGPTALRATGAISIDSAGRVITARQKQGHRPWVPKAGERVPDLAQLKRAHAHILLDQ